MTLENNKKFGIVERTLLFLIIIYLCSQQSNAYSCYTAIFDYGYCGYGPYCNQDYTGNYVGCSDSVASNMFYTNAYYYYWDYVYVYQYCHPYCATCYWAANSQCYTCYSPYYKWAQRDVCESYCPTGDYATSGGYYG